MMPPRFMRLANWSVYNDCGSRYFTESYAFGIIHWQCSIKLAQQHTGGRTLGADHISPPVLLGVDDGW